MTIKIKSLPLVPKLVKAGPDDGLKEGEFIVYPSTFIRKADAYGDVVAPSAFEQTLEEWRKSGLVMPGLFGHRMDDPDYFVAGATEFGTDTHGWWVKGEFDMENPKARQTYRLVKGRRLNQLSFAYDELESGLVELEDGTKANELRRLKVYEFSFVPVGANQDTSVVAVKGLLDGLKAGRVLSAKNEAVLRDAYNSIGAVLEKLSPEEDDDQSKASGPVSTGAPGASEAEAPSAPAVKEDAVDPSVATLSSMIRIRASMYAGD